MSKWISVSGRVPCLNQYVLVNVKFDGVRAAYYLDGEWYQQNDYCFPDGDVYMENSIPESLVTHWQPLPEPPQ